MGKNSTLASVGEAGNRVEGWRDSIGIRAQVEPGIIPGM